MKNLILASTMMLGVIAGMGHNGPPRVVTTATTHAAPQAVLPRRIVDENRRNQKLQQRLRREKKRQCNRDNSRSERKVIKFGHGYRAGKMFKGHRI